ncbi:MAG TPA: ATP-binding protein, partial [Burkholderiales bacterium]|nr:ATP-binding protein [Burkholderiales bacterium]
PAADAGVAQKMREVMERQVHHLARLVDDLLDVSRVVRGKIELRKEPVALSSVIERAVETAQPLIDARLHRLEISLPEEPPVVDADPMRLAQVVANLLTNSAKYTEPGGKIAVSVRASGEEAVLSVVDNGMGIAPELLPQVFDSFVQGNHAAQQGQGGLGIGLTLVKNLVELHGGTVRAESEGPGRGARFTVRLPRLAAGARRAAAAPSAEAAPAGRRILVVDDNRDAADSLAALLRVQANDVRVAYDGASAIDIAAQQRPALIFLDIGMPGMDGHETARRIRATPGLEGVVLVALTGWGQEADRKRSSAAGFDHHLVKPAQAAALRGILAAI